MGIRPSDKSYLPVRHYQMWLSPQCHRGNGLRHNAIFKYCFTDKMPFLLFNTFITVRLRSSVELSSHLELDTAAAQAPRRRPGLATAAGQGHPGRASAGAQTSPLPPPEPRPRHRRSPRPSRPRRRRRPSSGIATAADRAQALPPPSPELRHR
jgi:hypothetical protein